MVKKKGTPARESKKGVLVRVRRGQTYDDGRKVWTPFDRLEVTAAQLKQNPRALQRVEEVTSGSIKRS